MQSKVLFSECLEKEKSEVVEANLLSPRVSFWTQILFSFSSSGKILKIKSARLSEQLLQAAQHLWFEFLGVLEDDMFIKGGPEARFHVTSGLIGCIGVSRQNSVGMSLGQMGKQLHAGVI